MQQQLRRGGFDVTYFATQDSRRIMMNGECPLIVAGHNGSSIFDPLATLEFWTISPLVFAIVSAPTGTIQGTRTFALRWCACA